MLGILGLLNPEWEKRRRANERAYFEDHVKDAVVFDPLTTKWKQYLILDGKRYRPELLFPESRPVSSAKKVSEVKKGVMSPSGRWVYVNLRHPRGEPLNLYQPGTKVGSVRFTTDVVIPALLEWNTAKTDLTTWMSLTPSEMLTQRNGIRRASGDVVVYGLGMGWFLAQVCAKKTVKRVTVVEKSQEILDWLGPKIRELYPQTAKVADWVCADAYEYASGLTSEDDRTHLFDIWDGYKDAPWDDKFQRLKVYLPKVWGWGDHYVKELR